MLHMLCGKTLKDKVSNDKISKIADVESIEEFATTDTAVAETCEEDGRRKGTSAGTAL